MLKKNHIQAELQLISPAVADLPNTTPFGVPFQYFDQLPNRILQKISEQADHEESKSELSPLLQSLRSENPFHVPERYFRQFEFNAPVEDQKVISMYPRKKWISYAIAACLIGVIGSLLYFGYFADIEKIERSNVASLSIDGQQFTTESIQTYLSEVEHTTDMSIPVTELPSESNLLVEMTPQIISEILKEIPENDISSFISQTEGGEMNLLN